MKASLTLTCSLALLCLAVVSVTIAADVPLLINVQGKLTDAGGDPVADGPYSVLFSIYDVATVGSDLWHETRTVTVSGGLFSIILGEVTTIPASLFDNTDLWLGMKVGADPEMTPRQRLTTSPYAFRVAGSSVGGGWVDDGSVVRLETSTDSVGIGTASPDAKLHVVADPGGGGVKGVSAASGGLSQHAGVAAINTASGPGLYASSDGWHAVLGINSDPDAAVMGRNDGTGPGVKGQNQSTGPAITGYASTGNLLELYTTPGPNLKLSVNNSGDLQTTGTIESTSGGFKFPDATVQMTAAMDEPGIASANSGGSVTLATMQDILTVTIEIPTDGYIVLEAKCYVIFQGTTGYNRAVLQIDETEGGSAEAPHCVVIGQNIHSGIEAYYLSSYLQRVYLKSQGTYTFRLEGYRLSNDPGTAKLFYPTLTAIFYSKSYGSVTTVVTAAEASQFDNAVPVAVNVDDGIEGETGSSQQLYEVDLCELELENARLRSELKRLQRERDEAEARRQEDARSKQQIEK